MIKHVERFNRKAIIGLHGILLGEEFQAYYRSRRVIGFSHLFNRDQNVHILGTGVSVYHSDTIRVRWKDFQLPNMADIWLGVLGQQQKIPFICIAHLSNWVRLLPGEGPSIYSTKMTAEDQTRVVRKYWPWSLHMGAFEDNGDGPD
jgi:hypothetical protein